MTYRESLYRQRIVHLQAELDARLQEILRERKADPIRACGYCGSPCRGPVCLAHSDLLGGE